MRQQRPALVVVGAVACLAACSGAVQVDSPEPSAAGAKACRALVAALPDKVGDQERREVDGDFSAAYGDPPIVLRCGVPRPDELMTNCVAVDDVDWYVVESDSVTTAITVGRAPNVQVRVPLDHGTAAATMVDVAGAIKAHTQPGGGC